MNPENFVNYQTEPSQYHHWKLSFEGPVATLKADFDENGGLRPGYKLKLNSYDLGVDIELHDAINRIRFEHPEVRSVVVTSAKDKVFCSGANIFMLGLSSHAWKVNFCKFTNETRNGLEDSSAHSGLKFLAAVNGACAGGGYELALACDEILLVDDRSSAVSLPEVPLLGVLPGTGQHAQQRYLGQADGGGAVINQQNFVAGQRQFVAATSAGAVDRCQKLQTAVRRRVFQAITRLVGEFAEIDFPSVAAQAEHKDVGAGAKHFVLGAGHHHAAHLGVLKADAVDGVVQLDVHAQVVAIELELVAGAQAAVFIKVRFERGHRALKAQFPVVVLAGFGLVVDKVFRVHNSLGG